MHVELLTDSKHTTKILVDLLVKCDLAAWAVAWATGEHDVLDAAYEHRAKFRHLVFGTHGYITSPEAIELFQAEPMFRVVLPKGPLFHPKVYLFRCGDDWSAVVGSHNLTSAAFNRNREVSTLIQGKGTEPELRKLFAYVAQTWAGGEEVLSDWLYAYRVNHNRAKVAYKDLEDWTPAKPPKTPDDIPGPHEMGWKRFVEQVQVQKPGIGHTLEGRLQVLESIQARLASEPTYAELDEDDRKRVAGTMGSADAKAKDGTLDWGYFGAMGSNGSFSTTVINAAQGLSDALDCIPFTGTVSRDHYDAFVDKFKVALDPALYASGGIGNGTRLLAMKRPDQFVCLNEPNKKGIADHFNIPQNTGLDNYWERIVQRIRGTDWWQADEPPPGTLEHRVWRGRAALLDAIYYDPRPKSKKA